MVHRYWHAFVLNLVLPLISFLVGLMSTGTAWVWARFVKRRSIFGLHLSFMCVDYRDVRELILSWLAIAFPILHVLYGVLCVKAFSTFFCTKMLDGSWALTAAPDIVCWEGDHIIMIFISILAIIMYVVGIPAYVLFALLYAHKNDKFKDPEWLQVLGFLYTRYGNVSLRFPSFSSLNLELAHHGTFNAQFYLGSPIFAEPAFYWWELMFLMRRLSFVLCMVVLNSNPFAQGVTAARYPRSIDFDALARTHKAALMTHRPLAGGSSRSYRCVYTGSVHEPVPSACFTRAFSRCSFVRSE